MQINLINGYYIEVDPLNYTLKQKYKGTTKDGKPKESERTHGHYGKLDGAIDCFLRLNQIDVGTKLSVDLREYVDFVRDANLQAVQAVKSVLLANGYDVERSRNDTFRNG